MAFKKTIETKSGLIVQDAYFRISEQSGDKNNINLRIRVYASKEKADNGFNSIDEDKIYNFAPSVIEGSENFIKQGYEYLKTLSEYTDVIDC